MDQVTVRVLFEKVKELEGALDVERGGFMLRVNQLSRECDNLRSMGRISDDRLRSEENKVVELEAQLDQDIKDEDELEKGCRLLEAKVDALEKELSELKSDRSLVQDYLDAVKPPFDIGDDMTVEFAVEIADLNARNEKTEAKVVELEQCRVADKKELKHVVELVAEDIDGEVKLRLAAEARVAELEKELRVTLLRAKSAEAMFRSEVAKAAELERCRIISVLEE